MIGISLFIIMIIIIIVISIIRNTTKLAKILAKHVFEVILQNINQLECFHGNPLIF